MWRLEMGVEVGNGCGGWEWVCRLVMGVEVENGC